MKIRIDDKEISRIAVSNQKNNKQKPVKQNILKKSKSDKK